MKCVSLWPYLGLQWASPWTETHCCLQHFLNRCTSLHPGWLRPRDEMGPESEVLDKKKKNLSFERLRWMNFYIYFLFRLHIKYHLSNHFNKYLLRYYETLYIKAAAHMLTLNLCTLDVCVTVGAPFCNLGMLGTVHLLSTQDVGGHGRWRQVTVGRVAAT